MEEDFGDFEEVSENSQVTDNPQPGFTRARMPRGREKVGTILQRLGGNRMEVQSSDGKVRNCRVPGRFKRSLWLRPNDVVLIEPWESDDEKGDVIYKYSSSEITQLKKRNLLNTVKDGF